MPASERSTPASERLLPASERLLPASDEIHAEAMAIVRDAATRISQTTGKTATFDDATVILVEEILITVADALDESRHKSRVATAAMTVLLVLCGFAAAMVLCTARHG